MPNLYDIRVTADHVYHDIEADTEDEAFDIAEERLLDNGDLDFEIERFEADLDDEVDLT